MKRNNILDMMNQQPQKSATIQFVRGSVHQQEEPPQEEKKGFEFSQFNKEIMEIRESLTMNHGDVLQKDITLPDIKEELRAIVDKLTIDKLKKHKVSETRRESIVRYIMQSMTEFGPITDLFHTSGVTDIHIKRWDYITYRKDGILYPSALQFSSPDEVLELAYRMLRESDHLNTRKVNWTKPIENASLPDGTRFNIMVNPVSSMGPTISIRKHRGGFFTEQQLIQKGTLTLQTAHALKRFAEARCNVLIVGGGGTGKTELQRLYGTYVPLGLNIDTIEDIDELQLYKVNDNVRSLISRNVSEEDREQNQKMGTAHDILRWGSLRSDVDIVIIGEILENKAFVNLLDAQGIGQPGSFAGMHADGPLAALLRGVSMYAAEFPNLSEKFIMTHIANTVDIIFTMKRYRKDGSRRLARITQINGIKDGQFLLEDLFRYEVHQGHYRTNEKINPRILEKFEDNEVPFDLDILDGWQQVAAASLES
jgi:pilus assembly protein CpaF